MLRNVAAATRPIRYKWDEITFGSRSGRALESLRGSCRGRPLLVVGNGPSLNRTPLDEFRGVTSIGMNKIDLLFGRVAWRPDLIVCINNLVVKQHAAQFASSGIPVYLSWKCRHFLPWRARRKVNFFLSLDTDAFSRDITRGVGWGSTVTYTALQFAYFMEADPVLIVGVDHSFKAEGPAHDIARREGPDVNHFDPDYFKAGTYWGLPDLDGSERAYARARCEVEAAGRRIFDATIDGKLRVFPRIAIDEAIAMARASSAT
jgi:hypothetical protein